MLMGSKPDAFEASAVEGEGKACTADADCPYPLYCILSACRPLGESGDTCGIDSDCNSPFYCVNGICSIGSGTASSEKGGSCTSDTDCLPPLYCILKKCNPLGSLADACAQDYDCEYPCVCEAGRCAHKSGGTQVGGSSTPGTPCKSDIDCAPPLFCILQTCRYLGKEGDSCAASADCSIPLVCENQKCVMSSAQPSTIGLGSVQPKLAAECRKDEECKKKGVKYKYCIAGKCRENLSGVGEVCQYTTDCREGLFCIVAVCRKEQSGQGEACRSNDDCKRPLLCVSFVCSE